MKVLLALDGSSCSSAALQDFLQAFWPDGTQVKVLSVARAIPYIPDPFLLGATAHIESDTSEFDLAGEIVARAAETIQRKAPSLEVVTEVVSGSPKELVVEQAEEWGADLIWLGSHGRGAVKRLFLGSVAQGAVNHASCSVHISRAKT